MVFKILPIAIYVVTQPDTIAIPGKKLSIIPLVFSVTKLEISVNKNVVTEPTIPDSIGLLCVSLFVLSMPL